MKFKWIAFFKKKHKCSFFLGTRSQVSFCARSLNLVWMWARWLLTPWTGHSCACQVQVQSLCGPWKEVTRSILSKQNERLHDNTIQWWSLHSWNVIIPFNFVRFLFCKQKRRGLLCMSLFCYLNPSCIYLSTILFLILIFINM